MRSLVHWLVGLVLLLAPAASPAAASSAHGEPPRADLVRALVVLHAWDGRRAAAWASNDVEALRQLYVARSAAAESDVRLLRAYAARGLVVRRLVTQVFGVRVLRHGGGTLRLRLLERVAGGEVVQDGRVSALPSSLPATRTLELRRSRGEWRVAVVSDSGRAPRAARH
jgi:hypothetical protein